MHGPFFIHDEPDHDRAYNTCLPGLLRIFHGLLHLLEATYDLRHLFDGIVDLRLGQRGSGRLFTHFFFQQAPPCAGYVPILVLITRRGRPTYGLFVGNDTGAVHQGIGRQNQRIPSYRRHR